MGFRDYVGYFVSIITFCLFLAFVGDVFYLVVVAELKGVSAMITNGFNPLDKTLLISVASAGVIFGMIVGIGTIYDDVKKERQ